LPNSTSQHAKRDVWVHKKVVSRHLIGVPQVMRAGTDVKKNEQRKSTPDSYVGIIRQYIFMKK